MDNNVIVLADTLPEIAKAVRFALQAYAEADADWVEAALRLIEELTRARNKCGADRQFSIWLVHNDLDDLSKDDRWAAINLGQDIDLARQVLQETKSRSLQLIWRSNQERYNEAIRFRNVTKPKEPETDLSDADTATTEPVKQPDLVVKFKEATGRVLFNHFDRNTRTSKRLCEHLNQSQAKKLADFIRTTRQLPTPNNSSDRLGLTTLWREAPRALAYAYTLGESEGDALMRVIAEWHSKIIPVIAEWMAAGEPKHDRWYKPAPVLAAVVPSQVSFDNIKDQILADAAAAVRPLTDPSCRAAHEGPIRHHGVDIWPVALARYGFEEAWLAMTVWQIIDDGLRVCQPNAKTRAAMFFKPFIGCFRNLNPAAGEALFKILHAQDLHPEATSPEDNLCPPYDVIQ